jgi:pilus assembly protein Flp/PilA
MKSVSSLMNKRSVSKDERGQGLAEYIIIVILVAIIVLVAVRLFGKSVFNQFGNATQQIDTLGGGTTTN